jgi:hypothetical protein
MQTESCVFYVSRLLGNVDWFPWPRRRENGVGGMLSGPM